MTELADRAAAGDTSQVNIREATAEDAEFLAWVLLTAMRSHLERGIWEYLLDRDEAGTLAFLEKLVVTGPDHMFKYSRYLVAEVEGQPAAALCGYDPATHGMEVYLPVAIGIVMDEGASQEDLDTLMQRGGVITGCFDDDPTNCWVVESVATAPAFRRRGLVDRLLDEILLRGREGGFTTAKITILIGNEPARAAYVKKGFASVGECRTDDFEAAMKCPGLEHFTLSL